MSKRRLQKNYSKHAVTVMQHKGFKASLMRAERLRDTGHAHALPPGTPIETFHVDAIPARPESWVGGPGSYVCPVSPEWGLWFDWTNNDALNTAVLTSVKGMNPITGEKIKSLSLKQYGEECPKHKTAFEGDLYCPKCGYKWPAQNYVASPNVLWWDGFRQTDTVRQFFFSEEARRDIASHVIGKKNTVPAFGFAFFEPKERRKSFGVCRSAGLGLGLMGGTSGPQGPQGGAGSGTVTQDFWPPSVSKDWTYYVSNSSSGEYPKTAHPVATYFTCSASNLAQNESIPQIHVKSVNRSPLTRADVSVGAGAEIKQEIIADSLAVDQWKPKPSAIIRLYFVFLEEFEDMVRKGGVKNLEGNPEGFLHGLPIG